MKVDDLNRLTNSPSFRGGMEKFIQKAGEEAAKKLIPSQNCWKQLEK